MLTAPGAERCDRCRHAESQHARDGRRCAGCAAPCVYRLYRARRPLVPDLGYRRRLLAIRREQRRLEREAREAARPRCVACAHREQLHADPTLPGGAWCAECAAPCAFRAEAGR